jgi:outer membrane protein assembly factor BamE (lipoprotein component of BamABCDE complex)
VRDVLGSPLIADPFHAQRWDYVVVIRRPGTEPQQRSVTVLFDGDNVKSVQAPSCRASWSSSPRSAGPAAAASRPSSS